MPSGARPGLHLFSSHLVTCLRDSGSDSVGALSDSHRTALSGQRRATRSRPPARRGDTMRGLRPLSSRVTLVRVGGLVLVATCLSAPAPAQEPDEPKETQQGKPA